MSTNLEYMSNAQVSAIITTVLERCQKENEQSVLMHPIENIVERTSYYTGFPRATLSQMLKAHKKTKLQQSYKFDVPERILISGALQKFYSEGKYPKYHDIYTLLGDTHNLKDFYHFKNEMTEIGFCYTPTKHNWLLVENPEHRFERYNYLNKIVKFRKENRKIVYVDVKLMSRCQELDSYVEKKLPIDQSIFLHAISQDGIENFLFSNVLSSNLYKKWVFDVLSPTLPPGTVLVLCDNCMLGDLVNNNLSRYSSKTEMINWLIGNNIPCSEAMHKSELFELYEKSPKRSKEYVIDKLLQANGFEVLHIPYKCKGLSMTTILWDEIKKSASFLKSPNPGKKPLFLRDLEKLCSIKAVELQKEILRMGNQILSLDSQIEEHLDKNYTFDVPHQQSF